MRWFVCLGIFLVCGAIPGGAQELRDGGLEDWTEKTDAPLAAWRYYTSGKFLLTRETNAVEGTACARFAFQETPNASQGIVQHMKVVEGMQYTLCAYVREDPEANVKGTGRVELGIEWRDAQGKEVARLFHSGSSGPLSKLRWQKTCLKKVRAPKGAVEAVVGVHVLDGTAGAKGAVLVDRVEWIQE